MRKPDHFILHVGTNDLNTERSPELIVKSIATTLKGNSRNVSVSNVIVRADNSNLNEKGCAVNAHSLEDKKIIDSKTILKSMRRENTNSLRNKFELIVDQVKGNIDALMISETKTDDSFLLGNFLIGGFSKPLQVRS